MDNNEKPDSTQEFAILNELTGGLIYVGIESHLQNRQGSTTTYEQRAVMQTNITTPDGHCKYLMDSNLIRYHKKKEQPFEPPEGVEYYKELNTRHIFNIHRRDATLQNHDDVLHDFISQLVRFKFNYANSPHLIPVSNAYPRTNQTEGSFPYQHQPEAYGLVTPGPPSTYQSSSESSIESAFNRYELPVQVPGHSSSSEENGIIVRDLPPRLSIDEADLRGNGSSSSSSFDLKDVRKRIAPRYPSFYRKEVHVSSPPKHPLYEQQDLANLVPGSDQDLSPSSEDLRGTIPQDNASMDQTEVHPLSRVLDANPFPSLKVISNQKEFRDSTKQPKSVRRNKNDQGAPAVVPAKKKKKPFDQRKQQFRAQQTYPSSNETVVRDPAQSVYPLPDRSNISGHTRQDQLPWGSIPQAHQPNVWTTFPQTHPTHVQTNVQSPVQPTYQYYDRNRMCSTASTAHPGSYQTTSWTPSPRVYNYMGNPGQQAPTAFHRTNVAFPITSAAPCGNDNRNQVPLADRQPADEQRYSSTHIHKKEAQNQLLSAFSRLMNEEEVTLTLPDQKDKENQIVSAPSNQQDQKDEQGQDSFVQSEQKDSQSQPSTSRRRKKKKRNKKKSVSQGQKDDQDKASAFFPSLVQEKTPSAIPQQKDEEEKDSSTDTCQNQPAPASGQKKKKSHVPPVVPPIVPPMDPPIVSPTYDEEDYEPPIILKPNQWSRHQKIPPRFKPQNGASDVQEPPKIDNKKRDPPPRPRVPNVPKLHPIPPRFIQQANLEQYFNATAQEGDSQFPPEGSSFASADLHQDPQPIPTERPSHISTTGPRHFTPAPSSFEASADSRQDPQPIPTEPPLHISTTGPRHFIPAPSSFEGSADLHQDPQPIPTEPPSHISTTGPRHFTAPSSFAASADLPQDPQLIPTEPSSHISTTGPRHFTPEPSSFEGIRQNFNVPAQQMITGPPPYVHGPRQNINLTPQYINTARPSYVPSHGVRQNFNVVPQQMIPGPAPYVPRHNYNYTPQYINPGMRPNFNFPPSQMSRPARFVPIPGPAQQMNARHFPLPPSRGQYVGPQPFVGQRPVYPYPQRFYYPRTPFYPRPRILVDPNRTPSPPIPVVFSPRNEVPTQSPRRPYRDSKRPPKQH